MNLSLFVVGLGLGFSLGITFSILLSRYLPSAWDVERKNKR